MITGRKPSDKFLRGGAGGQVVHVAAVHEALIYHFGELGQKAVVVAVGVQDIGGLCVIAQLPLFHPAEGLGHGAETAWQKDHCIGKILHGGDAFRDVPDIDSLGQPDAFRTHGYASFRIV